MTEDSKTRLFDWRDFALLHRLRNKGLCLNARLAHTRGPHALQHALFDVIAPRRTSCTWVVRTKDNGDASGVGQISVHEDEGHARLTFLSPAEIVEQASGDHLLETLAATAGARGAHHLIAEVDEDAEAFEALRRSGFAIYARQRIWRLFPTPVAANESEQAWVKENSAHKEGVFNLYADTVPGLVQQIEASPRRSELGLVHFGENEIYGYLDIDQGPLGVWIQPYFHPAAEDLDDLISNQLAGHIKADDVPWFICVRSYQEWVSASLERLGFVPFADQAVMVKRLATPVLDRAQAAVPQMERTHPEATAPFANIDGSPQPVAATPDTGNGGSLRDK